MTYVDVAAGVIKDNASKILISLRHASLHQGGLWEFPGGKIETGESAEQALQRELSEELGIDVLAASPLITIRHRYPDKAVRLNVFTVERFKGIAVHANGQALSWVEPQNLSLYCFPAANTPIVTAARLPHCYGIWDDTDASASLTTLEKILLNGVKLVQARLKSLPAQTALPLIEQAVRLCRLHGARLLVNSAVTLTDRQERNPIDLPDTDLIGHIADGIHLTGRHLMAIQQRPNRCRWVAASCHNFDELCQAQHIAADFAVLAPVLPTFTHPEAEPMGWRRFAECVDPINLPVYALGGMTAADLETARRYGAQGIASIRAFL